MRSTRTVQPSVFQAPEIVHPIAAEPAILDERQ